MQEAVDYSDLEAALRGCGATWNAAQAHGLLCGRLTLRGGEAAAEWLGVVLDGSDPDSAAQRDCAARLEAVFALTERQLAERQSQFMPLLPDDTSPATVRADALANWCEGWLHGLVSGGHTGGLKERLAAEPIADIIKDMLEITRATVDTGTHRESNEAAYVELVEYIRVAAQLAYEELAEFRPARGTDAGADLSNRIH